MSSINGNGNRNGRNGGGVMLTPADVEAATVFEPYPPEKYEAFREGHISADEFVDDLFRHVKADIARRERHLH
jgi:hypothetical protein